MSSPASEAEFLLSCIMHSEGKIDFEAVAKETGYTNVKSASNRLTAIKKAVLAKGNTVAASPAKKKAPATPKRARKSLKRVDRDDDSSDGMRDGSKGNSKAVKTAS